MSAHAIYYSKDKQKMMREVGSRAEYIKLRHSAWQQKLVKAVREGDETKKGRLLQMNYSCRCLSSGGGGKHGWEWGVVEGSKRVAGMERSPRYSEPFLISNSISAICVLCNHNFL